MPSIIPSWVYSIFATIIVGTIIVYGCSTVTLNLKNQAQSQQLSNIDQYVATQSLNLLTSTTQDNQSISEILNLPTQIGNQPYWISIVNDSSQAWIESGFGSTASSSQPSVYIPAQIAASGAFVSFYGRPLLQCFCENGTIILTLTSE